MKGGLYEPSFFIAFNEEIVGKGALCILKTNTHVYDYFRVRDRSG